MTKDEIIEYACTTPENTNPSVLGSMLDQYNSQTSLNLKNGSGINSIAQKGDNEALGKYSNAFGKNTIAGCNGFTIRYLRINGTAGSTWTGMDAIIDKFTLPESAVILDGDHVNLNSAVYSWVSFNSFTITGVNGILWLPGEAYTLVVNASDLPQAFVTAVQEMLNQGVIPLNTLLPEEYLGGSYVWFPNSTFRVLNQGDLSICDGSFAEGSNTLSLSSGAHAEGANTQALAYCSHAEGDGTLASGVDSHSEGVHTYATGIAAHAEGQATKATGDYAHAEGQGTEATGSYAHAEGYYSKATASQAHAEGSNTIASQNQSHAEGYSTTASGYHAHAEGESTVASGANSHAAGKGTIAQGDNQTVVGKYNRIANSGDIFVVGGGSAEHRENLLMVSKYGSPSGKITVINMGDSDASGLDTPACNLTFSFSNGDFEIKATSLAGYQLKINQDGIDYIGTDQSHYYKSWTDLLDPVS